MSLSFLGNNNKLELGGGNPSLDWISLTENVSTVIGYLANQFNTTGQLNTIVGYQAASAPLSVSGNNNLIVGTYAGFRNQGDFNTWLGTRAGYDNLTGSENVAVGYRAGSTIIDTWGNAVLGYEAGMTSTGDGNTHIGYKAGGEGALVTTDSNVSLGSQTTATGGDSIAIGPNVQVSGADSVAIGTGSIVTAPNTMVFAPNVTATACNSLLLMPRRDGGVTTHSTVEELNIYDVLKGERENSGAYAVELESDKLVLDNQVNRITLNSFGIEIYSDKNTTFLTPANFTSPVTFTDTVSMSETLVLTSGLRVSLGTTIFDDPVVFNDTVQFAVSNVVVDATTATSMFTRDLVVQDNAAFSNNARFLGSTVFDGTTTMNGSFVLNDTFEVLGGADIGGDLNVLGTMTASNIDAPQARITDARVTNLDITGSVNFPAGFNLGGSNGDTTIVQQLLGSNVSFDTLVVNSNLLIKGNMSNVGTVQFDDMRTGVMRVDNNLWCVNNATFEDDVHVAETLHAKLVMTEDLVTDEFVTGHVTATTATVDTYNGVRILLTSHIDTPNVVSQFATIEDLTGYTAAFSNMTIESLSVSSDLHAKLLTADESRMRDASVSNLTAEQANLSNVSVSNAAIEKATVTDGNFINLYGSNVSALSNYATSYVGEYACFSNIKVSGGISTDVLVILDNLQVTNDVTISGDLNVSGHADIGSLETSNMVVDSNITVGNGVTWLNPMDPSGNSQWTMNLEYNYSPCNEYADLAIRSSSGTSFVLNDDFEPGILNFTGKHRCSTLDKGLETGTVVVTTGEYVGLDGNTRPTIDEAIPFVKLCDAAKDARAFGVVSGYEDDGLKRIYRLANAVFAYDKTDPADRKVIVNSVGEGGMWVCDANGPLSNGDLVTTSAVCGHGQRQSDDIVRSYTIAKVTGDVKRWEPYFDPLTNREVMRSFIGVTYKF
nr:hypothetical protein TetV2_00110 [Oceanusvirus sp.]